MPTPRSPSGFNLIEMVLVSALFSLVLGALASLFMPIFASQKVVFSGMRAQGEAFLGLKTISGELAASSEIYLPPRTAGGTGSSGDVLSGCSNYLSLLGAGGAGVIDPAESNHAFYFCVHEGNLLYYSETGSPTFCPMITPTCGEGTHAVVARNISLLPGYAKFYARHAGNENLLEIRYQSSFSGTAEPIRTALMVPW